MAGVKIACASTILNMANDLNFLHTLIETKISVQHVICSFLNYIIAPPSFTYAIPILDSFDGNMVTYIDTYSFTQMEMHENRFWFWYSEPFFTIADTFLLNIKNNSGQIKLISTFLLYLQAADLSRSDIESKYSFENIHYSIEIQWNSNICIKALT